MRRRILSAVVVIACVLWVSCMGSQQTGLSEPYANYLTTINPKYMVTPDEARKWHEYKDKAGPTYSGSPSWKSYMAFLEEKLKQYGVVDITRNAWTYDLWSTSEWPDSSNWTLVSNGQPVKVAHYGAYSGSTGAEGITRDLALYTPNPPARWNLLFSGPATTKS